MEHKFYIEKPNGSLEARTLKRRASTLGFMPISNQAPLLTFILRRFRGLGFKPKLKAAF
jgi:hypothetical protein